MTTESTITPAGYWSRPQRELLDALGSSPSGLTAAEASRRLVEVGPNLLQVKPQVTALRLLANQFKNPIVLILIFATGVSAVTQDWVDALIILAIVLGSALLSVF